MTDMPYKFTFDLSKVPRFFFTEIALISYKKGIHKSFLKTLHDIIIKFRIQEVTGLNLSDALVLVEDLIDLHAVNRIERDNFSQTKKRALFLPHCSRKYLDSHLCKASFDADVPSFKCAHCSPDCLVNNADCLARKKGYDIYLLPGGSCIPKILKANRYDGVVGVACGEEIKVLGPLLNSMNVAYQSVPLIKNGCASTVFNMESLAKVL
jgi:uncharacterized protein